LREVTRHYFGAQSTLSYKAKGQAIDFAQPKQSHKSKLGFVTLPPSVNLVVKS
jgi:hypothetical protein